MNTYVPCTRFITSAAIRRFTSIDVTCSPVRQTAFLFMFDSPLGALRPPMSGDIEREIATENCRDAIAVDFSNHDHGQCKCWQGEVADMLWQRECLKDSARTSREE